MKKDYKEWMPKKAEINNEAARPKRYTKKDIWYAYIGENVGHEIDGKGERFVRPVLILKGHNKSTCHVVPLSTTKRRGKFWHEFDGHTGKKSVALLTQTRNIDTSRLIKRIGWVDAETFKTIRNKIRDILGLKAISPKPPSPTRLLDTKTATMRQDKRKCSSSEKIIHPPQSGGRQSLI